MSERILVVGSGGREHALTWKISEKNPDRRLFIAPGNPGTALLGKNIDISVEETDKLVGFARDHKIDLVVVGPEAPLANGLINSLSSEGIPGFGPTQEAARLETSKAYATEFMRRHDIPHPESHISTNVDDALRFIEHPLWPEMVIKADGLAAGKGVIIPKSTQEAITAVTEIMEIHTFGHAGDTVVFQKKLKGYELSILALSDGKDVAILPAAQDHKRIFDNDEGPNTGGMGAYAPVPRVTPQMMDDINKNILQKTIDGMREEGNEFRGVLYAGLMMTADGPKVLEFNVRFGDPETQALAMLIGSDLIPAMLACARGNSLHESPVQIKPGAAVAVVLAAGGYPGKYKTGSIIKGLDKQNPNAQVFHAGTKRLPNGDIITAGGRVLTVTAYSPDGIRFAQNAVYRHVSNIDFEGKQFRKDIAARALKG